jgi:hypothetical protein
MKLITFALEVWIASLLGLLLRKFTYKLSNEKMVRYSLNIIGDFFIELAVNLAVNILIKS